MSLNKQPVNINFAQGVDLKSDKWQLPIGKFLRLVNSVFTKGGLLQKRNGFPALNALPDTSYSYLTTFKDDLTALGSSLAARSKASNSWVVKGHLQPCQVSTLSLIRSNTNQSAADTAVSSSGLVCTVYADFDGTNTLYKFAVADSITGQNLIQPQVIPAGSGGTVDRPARVFVLGNYFVIVFAALISATHQLQMVPINLANLSVGAAVTLSTSFNPPATLAMDGVVVSGNLYLAWNGASTSGIHMTYVDSNLNQHNTVTPDTAHQANYLSVCADLTGGSPQIYVAYNLTSTTAGYVFSVDAALLSIFTPQQWSTSGNVLNIATVAQNAVCTIFEEPSSPYGYDSSIPNHIIRKIPVTSTGTVGSFTTIARGVGIASKAFIVNGIQYLLSAYQSDFQPSYFLLNDSGQVIAKTAYSNGGGYVTTALPSVTVKGTTANVGYQIKDLVEAANKAQGVANPAGIYSQTGLNLASYDFTTGGLTTAEIGNNLNISGGFLWAYDGYTPAEQGFFLWPDSVEVTTSTSGGNLAAQTYFYQATYEWTDNQGNAFRSAPSVPVKVVTTGSTSANTIDVPTLRLTYKLNNPVKIVVYRWSTAQQEYYQVTSITAPTLNDPTVDYVAVTDTLSDAEILGNSLIYTTGGVLENISAPPCAALTLFDTRLWFIDAEDRDVLGYSKQVIESTPVEISDLLTFYVPPTIGANSSLGPMQALAPMDDKLIIFRADSIVYINGVGPNNTGADNGYSQPLFITSTVGCANPNSLVLIPDGLLFESDKGIWLLGRNLSTQYIGAPVESLTQGATVKSAVSIPGTNQVRFAMSSGIVIMYDYYYQQWGWFEGTPQVSATIYEGAHTFINTLGQVAQESVNTYFDMSKPVLMSFATGWINLAGLQGFERFYQMYLLGQTYTPFKLAVQFAFDYSQSPSQSVVVTPDNNATTWGSDSSWGSMGPWGGPGNVFEARIFPDTQKCGAFQVIVNELTDVPNGQPGAGLTLSGIDLVVGVKKGYRTSTATRSFG